MEDAAVDIPEDTVPSPTLPSQDAPLTEDTIQTDEMKRAGIIVNTAMRIAVCLGCRCAIKPGSIYSHVSREHSLPVKRKFCEGLGAKYNLHQEPVRPGEIVDAIYGFALFPNYWSCNKCGAAFQLESSATRHHRDIPSCQSSSHTKRFAQSYNAKSNRGFFGVTIPSSHRSDPSADIVALIKKTYSPTPFHAVPIKAIGFRDANHFLSIEKWSEYVEGMTGEQIWNIVRESEPDVRELVKEIVHDYANEAVKNLSAARNSIRVAIGDYNG